MLEEVEMELVILDDLDVIEHLDEVHLVECIDQLFSLNVSITIVLQVIEVMVEIDEIDIGEVQITVEEMVEIDEMVLLDEILKYIMVTT